MAWKNVEFADVNNLKHAREQLHQASQIVAAVGRTYNPKVKDDHYANFFWNSQISMLQGSPIEGDKNFSAALDLSTLTVHLITESNDSIANFSFDNKSQKQSLLWLEGELVRLGLNGSLLNLQLPYEMPVYPTSKGKDFQIDDPLHFQELSNYFGNAHLITESVISGDSAASEIRCWPHHFDIASLITINDTGDPETSTSIGIGLSPGDEGYNEPYFYLTPWPYPSVADLPPIDGPGEWHSEGWVGGILTASELIAESDSSNQRALAEGFLKTGLDTLKALMDK